MSDLQKTIELAFDKKELTPDDTAAVYKAIDLLDSGALKVCENTNEGWAVNEWAKKAILLFFRTEKVSIIDNGAFNYLDKVPVKKWTGAEGVRVVPHALVRKGAFIEKGAVLMPSYVNIGAYVGSGTLVDTWATVGSCASIGSNVHLSGGVGIGGVLEPLQAKPVIIEDDAFIGSRCILVEGVHISKGAVLGAGVTITGSTKIIDVTCNESKTYNGFVPENCVVIPGSLPKDFKAGTYNVPCALIIGRRKASTDMKTSLNDALRTFEVSV